MPTSTPYSASRPSLAAERDVAITGAAPSSDAICSAASATPPEAPLTSTDSPARSSPLVTTASCAVTKTLGNDAASIHDTRAGTGIRARGSDSTYCAWHSRPWPMTRSPSRQPVTPAPTVATSPANSTPAVIGSPERRSLACVISPRLRPDARTRTSTCPGCGNRHRDVLHFDPAAVGIGNDTDCTHMGLLFRGLRRRGFVTALAAPARSTASSASARSAAASPPGLLPRTKGGRRSSMAASAPMRDSPATQSLR